MFVSFSALNNVRENMKRSSFLYLSAGITFFVVLSIPFLLSSQTDASGNRASNASGERVTAGWDTVIAPLCMSLEKEDAPKVTRSENEKKYALLKSFGGTVLFGVLAWLINRPYQKQRTAQEEVKHLESEIAVYDEYFTAHRALLTGPHKKLLQAKREELQRQLKEKRANPELWSPLAFKAVRFASWLTSGMAMLYGIGSLCEAKSFCNIPKAPTEENVKGEHKVLFTLYPDDPSRVIDLHDSLLTTTNKYLNAIGDIQKAAAPGTDENSLQTHPAIAIMLNETYPVLTNQLPENAFEKWHDNSLYQVLKNLKEEGRSLSKNTHQELFQRLSTHVGEVVNCDRMIRSGKVKEAYEQAGNTEDLTLKQKWWSFMMKASDAVGLRVLGDVAARQLELETYLPTYFSALDRYKKIKKS